MSDAEIAAVRTGVAWSTDPPVVVLRVHGDDAFTVMDRACAADLFVRDGQVRPTLLLDDRARVFADVYVGQDDEAYLLFSEGPTAPDLVAHLRAAAPPGARFSIEELTSDHETLSVHGPYAWELIGELLGPDLIGLPYLYFYRAGDVLCLRAGKTGEYGYDLLVPRAQTADLHARLKEAGRAFDLTRVGLPALEQCSLENGFFNVRREGARGLSPIELGQQWRVSPNKEFFVGVTSLRAMRDSSVPRRLTYLTAKGVLREGDAVRYKDARIGEVLAAGFSSTAGIHVAAALLDRPFHHAGIDAFTSGDASAPEPVRTVSPPVLDNRSLYINPQRHAYATRGRDTFPALV